MNRIRLIVVGQLKTSWADEACRHYLEALRRYVPCEVHAVRDAKSRDLARRKAEEGQAVLAALSPRDLAVGLDEAGEAPGSLGLAELMRRLLDDPGRAPCFVIGGPYGHAPQVLARFERRLSLGPYTLPHELARVVLLEQLYRALTILAGHPYHHG